MCLDFRKDGCRGLHMVAAGTVNDEAARGLHPTVLGGKENQVPACPLPTVAWRLNKKERRLCAGRSLCLIAEAYFALPNAIVPLNEPEENKRNTVQRVTS